MAAWKYWIDCPAQSGFLGSKAGAFRWGRLAAVLLMASLIIVGLAACGSEEPTPTATPPSQRISEPTPAGPTPVPENVGIAPDAIYFGQSAAFTGPAQDLGIYMRLGIEAAFAEVNRLGGVHRRLLSLVSLDDKYEPEFAATNTRTLIQEDQVFALIGGVGTPTSRSAAPIAAESNTPFIAPFTGAAFLRDTDAWDNIINLRASYNDETEEMVKRLTEELGIERIGIMYQDDSFGQAGYNGVLAAMERRGLELVSKGVYPRNTKAVKTALIDVSKVHPDAVIMVGAYEPISEFILWARETKLLDDAKLMVISFAGSRALTERLGPAGEGVYVTQVVPFPTDTSLPIVASYLKALADFDANAPPDFVSFEGYLAGRLAIAGLERCGRDLTRSCFVDSLLNGDPIDITGFPLNYSSSDNQGSDTVFLTVIGADGQYHPIENLSDALE